ncbi:hypothetical protein VPNG_03834 [Cytospora leucostoma]|uniref:Uncharacterized protein n=1 Tax=Cytospora leucostoma TaxID=1230097 RepID=A0A423XFD9_9PEZI|nr:hypothetical protein VPNG_03834 [Cytospora leucostoma]
MAHNQQLKPLDDEFVTRLMDCVFSEDHRLNENTIAYWTDFLSDGASENKSIIGILIAEKFSSEEWDGTEYWNADPAIQELFQGYDRTAYSRPDRQATDQAFQSTQAQMVPQNKHRPPTPETEPIDVGIHLEHGPYDQILTPPIKTPKRSRATRAADPQDVTRQHSGQADNESGTTDTNTTRGPPPRQLPSPQYDEQVDIDDDPERSHDNAQPAYPATDGSIPPPMQPSQQDMERSHDWKGQRMPALGVRLSHVSNFLSDEDVDRDISWKEHLAEVEEYLLHISTASEFGVIGPETRDMVDRLLEMVAAHKMFEEYHYNTFNSTKVITPDLINKPAPRLRYDPDLPIVLHGKGRPGANRRDEIMPGDFPDQPRVQARVNDMWHTDKEAKARLTDELRVHHQKALAEAEDDWWMLEAWDTPPADNLSVVENKTYEDIVAADGGRGLDGWVTTEPMPDGGDDLLRSIAGPAWLENDEFGNVENQLASTPWRRLVLPPTAEELGLARRNAGAGPGRKWPLRALEPHKLRRTEGKDDPQGFTVAMAQFWRDQGDTLRRAREGYIQRLGGRGPRAPLGAGPADGFVTPPKSIWGAYVWRAVDAETENHQDTLKQMRAVRKLFERELKVAPRNLLTDMDILYKLGYANRGLSGEVVVFEDPVTKTDAVLDLDPRRDFSSENGSLNDLDKMEIYWIRFILNNSITTQMTQQIEPRTSLYMTFAERLNRIFNDISDPLFGSTESKVSVEDLLDHMHKRTDGLVRTVKFYAHDAQRWLERLAAQGRCRYVEDWRCYGWVQRPVSDCHPEYLIDWKVAGVTQDTPSSDSPEDMVFSPRLKDLRTWGDVIQDGQPPQSLDWNVANYLYCLAYRWGWYMDKLENPGYGLEKIWKTRAALPVGNMQTVLDGIEQRYQVLADWQQRDDSWDNNPLVSLVKRTLPEKRNDATLTPETSIKIIRDHIIDEAVRNDSMLWPARNAHNCNDINDEKVRPPLWDWAKVEVRGPVKKFFDFNRWPPQLQTEERQREIKSDKDLSAQQLWNPITEDPTPWTYYRPKARPYVEEKVKYRPGHRIYPIGDTPQQKKVVENQLYASIGGAMGVLDDDHQRPGLFESLSGFFRRGHDDKGDDRGQPGSRLPRVDPKAIPKSHNPRAESNKKRKADDDFDDGPRKATRLTRDDLPYIAEEDPDMDVTLDPFLEL